MTKGGIENAIKEAMEHTEMGSGKFFKLLGLYLIVKQAEQGNEAVFWTHSLKREILIREIPSLVLEAGTDFSREGVLGYLLGMEYGNEDIVTVNCTHDLNSAIIKDVGELFYRIKTETC